MRVLIVTHYFPPEVGAPQARLSELAAWWVHRGEDVTVLTGMPNHPTGVVPPEYRRRRLAQEVQDGYRVVRTWLYATPNEGVLRKTLGHLSFMATSVALGMRAAGKADVVVVSSPTFFAVFAARFIARARRAALVQEVRDLWPAAMVELGVLTNPRIVRFLERLELGNYRAADAVVVVTEGFRQNLVSRGVPAGKVHTSRNGADLERFAPRGAADPAAVAMRRRLGAGAGECLVLYAGAHGISHALSSVARAAEKCAGAPIHFAFVGDGAEKAALEAQVARSLLGNVTLLPPVPRGEMPDLLAAADICLAPLRDVPLFATFIPSKLFEYLAAGKAVIGSVRGEAAAILAEAGAVVVEPEDPAALADAVRALAADPARRAEMGERGRAYVAERFDRRRQAEEYRLLLRRIAGHDEGPGHRR